MAPSVVLQDLAQDEAIRKNFEFLTNSKVFPKYDHLHQYKKENFSSVSDAVGLALLDKIQSINVDQCDPGDEDSFFIADIAEVIKSFQIWQDSLPMVQPFYAVKCNTNLMVIKTLAEMGCNFDCASKAEIDIVRSLGVETDRIIYANPCKTNSYIRYAREVDVQLTTVDNVQELYKIKKNHPDMGVLIRIATDDESAQCRLSTKFGCTMSSALNEILPTIAELGLNLKGVAFHVGSGATDFTSIYKAIKDSRVIFDKVLDMGLNPLELLDIGGGFERKSFKESSLTVRQSLQEFFPLEFTSKYNVRFMAEPGRFMVSNAFTLATNVIARRDVDSNDDIPPMLYINDGCYGNMNCIIFDHQKPEPFVLSHKGEFVYHKEQMKNSTGFEYSIWGPTCDGLDCVSSKATLSYDVQVGDWLYFPELGAYTSAASTSFNGFKGDANVYYVYSNVKGDDEGA